MLLYHQQSTPSVEIPSNFRKEAHLRIIHFNIKTMMTGIIKRLTDKGFGFITPDGQDKDVFFHSSALVDVTYPELQVNDKVSFDVEDSEKGPRAVNVRRA